MTKRINPLFTKNIENLVSENKKIDMTLSFLPCIKWLIVFLDYRNIPFKIFNLGAGVKRITTETDACPCCKRKL